jgi:hypothetical protein
MVNNGRSQHTQHCCVQPAYARTKESYVFFFKKTCKKGLSARFYIHSEYLLTLKNLIDGLELNLCYY